MVCAVLEHRVHSTWYTTVCAVLEHRVHSTWYMVQFMVHGRVHGTLYIIKVHKSGTWLEHGCNMVGTWLKVFTNIL